VTPVPAGPLAALLAAAAAGLAGDRPPTRRVRALARAATADGFGDRAHGRAESRRRRSGPGGLPGPVALDLVAAVLRGGVPVTGSLRMVAASLDSFGAPGREDLLLLADRFDLALDMRLEPASTWAVLLQDALLLARDSGLAPGPVLATAAADARRRRATRRRLTAARLGVRLVLPTGLCLLPAFMLLTVVPLVLALLGGAS